MLKVTVHKANIVNISADAIVYSANRNLIKGCPCSNIINSFM